jgi:hypothetical protein
MELHQEKQNTDVLHRLKEILQIILLPNEILVEHKIGRLIQKVDITKQVLLQTVEQNTIWIDLILAEKPLRGMKRML